MGINQFESALLDSRVALSISGPLEETPEMDVSPASSQPSSHAGSPAKLRRAANAKVLESVLASDSASFKDSETDSFKAAAALPALTPFDMHLKFARDVSSQSHTHFLLYTHNTNGALKTSRHLLLGLFFGLLLRLHFGLLFGCSRCFPGCLLFRLMMTLTIL